MNKIFDQDIPSWILYLTLDCVNLYNQYFFKSDYIDYPTKMANNENMGSMLRPDCCFP